MTTPDAARFSSSTSVGGTHHDDFAEVAAEFERNFAERGEVGACGEGFIRCSYATALNEIKEAMVRIARFIEKL